LIHGPVRVAIFSGAAVRRNLRSAAGVRYEFLPQNLRSKPTTAVDAALVELGASVTARHVSRLRRDLNGVPLGSLGRRVEAAAVRRSHHLGFDFHLSTTRPGEPASREVKARVEAAPRARAARPRTAKAEGAGFRETSRRLSILTDVVKAANSTLEPGRVMETIMSRVQLLVPSEAWTILLVDENRQELRAELAQGQGATGNGHGPLRLGEGVAGWVAQSGQATVVNDKGRSVLCAPLRSRGRTIGVVEVVNSGGKGFTRRDLDLLMTLVEPCAIAIENALLFKKAEELTITDDLTKLFNSRFLNLHVGRELKRCKRTGTSLSLVFLDLDGFKGINDLYGHMAGSRTLLEVGEIIRESVRDSDAVARYGGDEFVAVLPETGPEGALVIAERMRRAIGSHTFLRGQGLRATITASLGVASYPNHALTPEGLIQKADQAMYRAKERTKNDIEVAV
jgi:diguanylate cyclase (GGDEF)-like protein